MRKIAVILTAAAGCLLLATSAMATIPDAANSSCVFAVEAGGCADADGVWCPSGDADNLVIRATVRNALGDPLDACTLRLDITSVADPQHGAIGMCDPFAGGAGSATAVSDANGAASWTLSGGGVGRLDVSWTVTAECAVPEVELCNTTSSACMKSVDFNGDLIINFFDNFVYLPQLLGGAGWSGDLNCDTVVNFFDNFVYLPHLLGAHTCTGGALPTGSLAACP